MLFLSSSSWRQPEKAYKNRKCSWPMISRMLSCTQPSLSNTGSVFAFPAEATTGRSGCYPAAHINVLEVRVVHLALRHLLPHQTGNHALLWPNSTSTVKSLHQGGKVLLEVTKELLTWAPPCMINLGAMYLPRERNYFADFLSSHVIRVMVLPKEIRPHRICKWPTSSNLIVNCL